MKFSVSAINPQLNDYRSLAAASQESKFGFNHSFNTSSSPTPQSYEVSPNPPKTLEAVVERRAPSAKLLEQKPLNDHLNTFASSLSNNNNNTNSLNYNNDNGNSNVNLQNNNNINNITNNNNNLKCSNNNSLKTVIKSENIVKTEKPITAKSPHSIINTKMDSYSSSVHMLANSTANTVENPLINKTICETGSSNPLISVSSGMQVPLTSACVTSLMSMQPPQINGYLGIDSQSGIHQQMPHRSAFETSHAMMGNHLNLDDPYIREQQLRYSQMTEMSSVARPTVSYPSEIVSGRVGYDLGSRAYDSVAIPTSAAFERYDANCLTQRANMYPYLQPTLEDINNQQKYLHEQHQMAQAMLKAEHDENSGPLYPRPMYHYDPSSGPIPPGFSAINLSVKVAAAQAAQAAAFKANSMSSIGPAPAIDLSTSSMVSSSPHGFSAPHFGSQRLNGSPSHTSSPHMGGSPVSSPVNEQSLDLSVSRLPHGTAGSSPYANHQDAMAHGQGFSGPRSPQTEPVDFSAAPPRPIGFGLVAPIGQFSRESSPDSGTSHYIDSYRSEPNGKRNFFSYSVSIENKMQFRLYTYVS